VKGNSIKKQLELNKMAKLEKEIERIEQGEAWDENDRVVQIEIKRPLNKVVPIRLTADDWAELITEARELGVGPTTLARMWILERLRKHVLSPQETTRILSNLVEFAAPLQHSYPPLTPTEKKIMKFVSEGYINEVISKELGLTKQTLKRHLSSILKKISGIPLIASKGELDYEEDLERQSVTQIKE
jgi:hypothetical protein